MSKLWGGRFSKATHKLVEEFSNSIHFDQKLAKYDCLGSLHHIDVLKKAKLLNDAEYNKLKKGLTEILGSIENGSFFKEIDTSFEDIHSYIQHLLESKAGKAAAKLHTCRSRNDQVVLATKLYCAESILITTKLLSDFGDTLSGLVKKNAQLILPGYTHLQHAIPVSFSCYIGAYQEMLLRDLSRFLDIDKNLSITMGSGALAGTFIEAKNYHQAAKSNVPKSIHPPVNSIDTVSDRDFVIELLSALSVTGMHLSRLAEDMILWSSKEFDFIDIDDAFCTGSSLMPQKKNPDVLELVRGYTGRLYGNLINVLVMMKGLPLSYNRDMQHDKEPLFDSFEIVQKELAVLTALFRNVNFKTGNIAKQLADESLYATDIADYLVQQGVAFKDAHEIVGSLIRSKYASKAERMLKDMDAATLKKFHPSLTPAIIKKLLDPKTSTTAKKSTQKRKTR